MSSTFGWWPSSIMTSIFFSLIRIRPDQITDIVFLTFKKKKENYSISSFFFEMTFENVFISFKNVFIFSYFRFNSFPFNFGSCTCIYCCSENLRMLPIASHEKNIAGGDRSHSSYATINALQICDSSLSIVTVCLKNWVSPIDLIYYIFLRINQLNIRQNNEIKKNYFYQRHVDELNRYVIVHRSCVDLAQFKWNHSEM